MVRRFLTSLGVDYGQWRALLRAYLMLDYAALRGVYGQETARLAAYGLIMLCVLFGLLGLTPALVIWYSTDVLFAATVTVTVVGGSAAWWAVVQIPTVISPDDYAVVGFRPVSSRTYLAVRTAALLIHTGQVIVLTGYLPFAALLTRSNGSWRLVLGGTMAMTAAGVAATLAVVALHGGLMRVLGSMRTKRVTAYLMVLSPLAVFGGVTLLWYLLVDFGDFGLSFSVKDIVLPRTTWTLAYPGTWFGAYVPIVAGRAGAFEFMAAAESILLVLALSVALRSWVSSTYAVRVAQMTMDVTVRRSRPDPPWSRLRDETRAMAVLMRHQFRADMNAQASIVMSILMTLGFIWMTATIDLPGDPFVRSAERIGGGSGVMLLYAVYSLPSSLWMFLASDSRPQAAWPFFTTPSTHVRLIMAARNVVAVVTLPLAFVILVSFCTWAFGNVVHALLYSLFAVTIAYLALQVFVLVRPRLPFSTSPMQNQRPGLPFGGGLGFLLTMLIVPLWFLVPFLCRSWTGVALGFAGMIAISAGLNWLTRRRIVKRQHTIVYAG